MLNKFSTKQHTQRKFLIVRIISKYPVNKGEVSFPQVPEANKFS